MFEQELAFFIANQEELVAKFHGQALVLRGEKIEGVYPSALDAYLSARKQFQPGTFMIQQCEAGVGAYTVMINSNS